jgi:hypothetical protein
MHQSHDHRSLSVSQDQNCLPPVESRAVVAVAGLLKAVLKRKASRTGLEHRRPSPVSCVSSTSYQPCFASSGRVKPNQGLVSHRRKLIFPPACSHAHFAHLPIHSGEGDSNQHSNRYLPFGIMPTPLPPAHSFRDLTLTSHCHPIAVSPVVGLQRI